MIMAIKKFLKVQDANEKEVGKNIGRVITNLAINIFLLFHATFLSSYMKFLGAVVCSQNHNPRNYFYLCQLNSEEL